MSRRAQPCLMAAALLLACTVIIEPPEQPFTGYPSARPIDLGVALRVDDELRAAKWEKKQMGDTLRIPLGDVLIENSEVMARAIFRDVVVLDASAEKAAGDFDAVLAPRLALASRLQGSHGLSETTLTLKVEWRLEDSGGAPVWVETVSGTGKTKVGSAFTFRKNQRKQVRLALDDLFSRSFAAIAGSPEIARHAERVSDERWSLTRRPPE